MISQETYESRKIQYEKKYGEIRMLIIFEFLCKLQRYYGFEYFKENVLDFADDLKNFSNEDFSEVIKLLATRKNTNKLYFNEIFEVFRSVKRIRIQKEEFEQEKEEYSKNNTTIGMPQKVKEMINKIAESSKLPEKDEDDK